MFQFHNGSIKRTADPAQVDVLTSFNSTMVRLKVRINPFEGYQGKSFNSTMVRLKVGVPDMTRVDAVSFNSTMVRLKVARGLSMWFLLKFQFHNGSIKS